MADNLLKKVTAVEKTEKVTLAAEGQAVVDSASSPVGNTDDRIFLLNKQNSSPTTTAHPIIPIASTAHSRGFASLGAGRADILLVDNAAAIDLDPEPIPRDWILAGAPIASAKTLSRSRDWLSSVVVWDCTPGRFSWRYNKDEILFVISGLATITNKAGQNLDFEPGATLFFPAGAWCTWDIKERVRKVAILRQTLWQPLGMCVKVWAKLLRVAGVGGKSPL